MKPQITIVLTAYNMQQYIGETLCSIYAQTSDDWKLIIVDDESTDYTRQVIRACTYGKPRTTVLHETHKGLGTIRNYGIEIADTEWILPFDADDLMHPTLIEEFVKAIEANPEADLFVCWQHLFGAEDRIIERRWKGFESLLRFNHIPAQSCYRKTAWEKAGKYRANLHYDDWDLWLRLLNPDSKVIEIPKVLIEYRIRTDSVSHGMSSEEMQREKQYIRELNKNLYENAK